MELNQDLIEEGKALVTQLESSERVTCEDRLAIGRWSLRCAPAGTGQGTSSAVAGDVVGEYADAVGLAKNTLQEYRDVAARWEGEDASGLSWTLARKLAYRTDRQALIAAVFEKFGKVTPTTLSKYENWIRDENKRREEILQPVFTDQTEDEEFWDEEEVEVEYIYDPVNPPINTQPRKHGFSGPIRKLFAVVEHVKAAKEILMEESIPSVDYSNDEHFEEILTACDTIVTEIMDYREQVVAKRVKAGLSPEVG